MRTLRAIAIAFLLCSSLALAEDGGDGGSDGGDSGGAGNGSTGSGGDGINTSTGGAQTGLVQSGSGDCGGVPCSSAQAVSTDGRTGTNTGGGTGSGTGTTSGQATELVVAATVQSMGAMMDMGKGKSQSARDRMKYARETMKRAEKMGFDPSKAQTDTKLLRQGEVGKLGNVYEQATKGKRDDVLRFVEGMARGGKSTLASVLNKLPKSSFKTAALSKLGEVEGAGKDAKLADKSQTAGSTTPVSIGGGLGPPTAPTGIIPTDTMKKPTAEELAKIDALLGTLGADARKPMLGLGSSDPKAAGDADTKELAEMRARIQREQKATLSVATDDEDSIFRRVSRKYRQKAGELY